LLYSIGPSPDNSHQATANGALFKSLSEMTGGRLIVMDGPGLADLSQKSLSTSAIDTSCIISRLIRFEMDGITRLKCRWLPRAGLEN